MRDPLTPEEILLLLVNRGAFYTPADLCDSAALLLEWEDARQRRRTYPDHPLPALRHVYAYQLPWPGWVKIGHAYNPPQRIRCECCGCPIPEHLLRVAPERPGATERDLHRRFAPWRVPLPSRRPEWFYPLGEVVAWSGARTDWGFVRFEDLPGDWVPQ